MMRTRARLRRRSRGNAGSFTADQRGIAMLTVLFIGAALTIAATTASFMAIRGLKAQTNDVRGTQAVSYAESGLQQYLSSLSLGQFGISQILTAGCATAPLSIPQGTIGSGTYNAVLTVYNSATTPQVPPLPWTGPYAGPPCQGRSTSNLASQQYAVTATGVSGTGTRVIRSIVSISGSGLPTGVYVRTVNSNGNPSFNNISLFANGDVYGREKMAFTGTDPDYTLADVYCSAGKIVGTATTCPASYSTTQMPAAVHATGAIYASVSAGGGTKKGGEHPPSPNCTANPRGTTGQSLWDGSATGSTVTAGCTGQTGFPPTAKFTASDMVRITARQTLPQLTEAEYSSLKASAQSSGIYCSITTAGVSTCTKQGASWALPAIINDGDITGLSNFVVYIDYAVGNNPLSQGIKWNATVAPCSSTPSLNHSVVIVVRNGGVTFRGGGSMYGSVVAPDGVVDSAGGYTVNGSVIASQMQIRGNATFQLDSCASANLAAPLINVSAGHWSEIDR